MKCIYASSEFANHICNQNDIHFRKEKDIGWKSNNDHNFAWISHEFRWRKKHEANFKFHVDFMDCAQFKMWWYQLVMAAPSRTHASIHFKLHINHESNVANEWEKHRSYGNSKIEKETQHNTHESNEMQSQCTNSKRSPNELNYLRMKKFCWLWQIFSCSQTLSMANRCSSFDFHCIAYIPYVGERNNSQEVV